MRERAVATTLEKIEEVLGTVRPAIQMDGGDVELVDFDESEGLVTVRLMGHCVGCPMSRATLKQGIEARLKMAVPEVRGVAAV
ncbi:MAG TPA: NifU family protein [Gemmatimonadales bacterium]|nr:NifU family protein [Gemmatimonadales bacterium]